MVVKQEWLKQDARFDSSAFPDFDFQIRDVGTDPEVRQWLQSNGISWPGGEFPTDYELDKQHLTVRKGVLRFTSMHPSLPEVDPYEYIAESSSVENRMRYLIKNNIMFMPRNVRWVGVTASGSLECGTTKPTFMDKYFKWTCKGFGLGNIGSSNFWAENWESSLTELVYESETEAATEVECGLKIIPAVCMIEHSAPVQLGGAFGGIIDY